MTSGGGGNLPDLVRVIDGGQPQSTNPKAQRRQAPLKTMVGVDDWMMDGG